MVGAAVKWTEVVTAACSLASLVVAALAATFAYGAYRKQAGQLELARKHDLMWQAARVAAWLGTPEGPSRGALVGGTLSTLEGGPPSAAPWALGPGREPVLWYINASDLPIYEVRVEMWVRGELKLLGQYDLLMPSPAPSAVQASTADIVADFFKEKHRALQVGLAEFQLIDESLAQIVIQQATENMMFSFTDSEGTRWQRAGTGRLCNAVA